MSEEKSRFRIKKGEIEIEYEGPSKEVNERYREAFEWLKSLRPENREEKHSDEEQTGLEEKRGGARKELFSPKIDALIKGNYFKLPNKRKVSDVMKTLKEQGLPTSSKDKAVLISLKRRLGKTLKGTKEEKEWVFWTE